MWIETPKCTAWTADVQVPWLGLARLEAAHARAYNENRKKTKKSKEPHTRIPTLLRYFGKCLNLALGYLDMCTDHLELDTLD